MENLIMLSVMNVFNHGKSIAKMDLPLKDIELAKEELVSRGYLCSISDSQELIVSSKED
jgi:hypothetical protein